MSDSKKELTPEQLSKIAGGRGTSSAFSSSRASTRSSSHSVSSSYTAAKAPVKHRYSSSSSK